MEMLLYNDSDSRAPTPASMENKSYYNPSNDECTLLTRLVINTLVAGGLCALGIAGNALSFAVLRRDRQTPVASYLLQALAFTDSFFLSLFLVHFSIKDLFEYLHIDQNAYGFWIYARLYTYPLLFIGQTGTIWLTVLIASTRFIALCIPYKAVTLCTVPIIKKSIIAVAVFSVVYNLPRFFDTTVVYVERKNRYYFNHTSLGLSIMYQQIYSDIAYCVFNFVLPLVILAFLNAKLTLAYRRLMRKREQLHGSTAQTPERRKSVQGGGSGHIDPNITLVMIIVVLVFMLCHLPARIVQIVWQYRDKTCPSPEFFIKEISNVFEVLNSSTNFIIYCVFRQQFRDILGRQLCQLSTLRPRQDMISLNSMGNGNATTEKLPAPVDV